MQINVENINTILGMTTSGGCCNAVLFFAQKNSLECFYSKSLPVTVFTYTSILILRYEITGGYSTI